jgi:hypothetical protein
LGDEHLQIVAAEDRYMAFELFELTGKRALVTGSSQGIGFALALAAGSKSLAT